MATPDEMAVIRAALSEAQKSLVQTNQLLLQTLTEIKATHEELKADKDLIESFISGMDNLTERMNLQIEALVKLYKLQSQERANQQAQAHA